MKSTIAPKQTLLWQSTRRLQLHQSARTLQVGEIRTKPQPAIVKMFVQNISLAEHEHTAENLIIHHWEQREQKKYGQAENETLCSSGGGLTSPAENSHSAINNAINWREKNYYCAPRPQPSGAHWTRRKSLEWGNLEDTARSLFLYFL